MLKQFIADESGMEMVEWALVGTLFAIVAAAGYSSVATGVGNATTSITGSLP